MYEIFSLGKIKKTIDI